MKVKRFLYVKCSRRHNAKWHIAERKSEQYKVWSSQEKQWWNCNPKYNHTIGYCPTHPRPDRKQWPTCVSPWYEVSYEAPLPHEICQFCKAERYRGKWTPYDLEETINET